MMKCEKSKETKKEKVILLHFKYFIPLLRGKFQYGTLSLYVKILNIFHSLFFFLIRFKAESSCLFAK